MPDQLGNQTAGFGRKAEPTARRHGRFPSHTGSIRVRQIAMYAALWREVQLAYVVIVNSPANA